MQKVAIVTGGRGFLGRHICKALLARGYVVHSLDNDSTANSKLGLGINQINQFYRRPDGSFDTEPDESRLHEYWINLCHTDAVQRVVSDIVMVEGGIDEIWHFASAASPKEYKSAEYSTLMMGSAALDVLLWAAVRVATENRPVSLMFASSSEVYGDPPPEAFGPNGLSEDYRGNVSTTGPRSMYDESKRFGEALCAAFAREYGPRLRVLIPRIHNTFGPGMSNKDGRVVSTLLACGLTGEPFTLHGAGLQARTFCYVSDLIDQLLLLMDRGPSGEPINVGGTYRCTIDKLAKLVWSDVAHTDFPVVVQDAPQDIHDPLDRRPDLSKIEALGWTGPKIGIQMALVRTAMWMETVVDPDREIGDIAQS